MSTAAPALTSLVTEAQNCTLCADYLPLGPRPVFRLSATARMLIVGQAPGTKVHETGIPWNDPSGDRLRDWMGLDRDTFYDQRHIAIMPMGFCYPGRLPKGGDAPPRPECAPAWHSIMRGLMPRIELTLLVGSYAQAYYLAGQRKTSMTETVAAWRHYAPEFLPLPHPSWRNTAWLKKNPWFIQQVLPALRHQVRQLLTQR